MLAQVSKRRTSVDFTLVGIVLCLLGVGFVSLHSASNPAEPWHMAQLGWLVIGCCLATLVAIVDYRLFERHAYLLYSGVVALLVVVLFAGVQGNAMRWLNLGIFVAQPSELMKVAIIFVTARFLHDSPISGHYRLRDLAVPFGLVAVPMVLVAVEPDLGTALVIFAIFMSVVLFAGIKRSSIVIMLLTVVALALPVWQWGMQPYQRTRVTAFLDPEGLSFQSAWQVRQSIIAVASGGWSGKGHRMGSQVQSGFVPENQNDFIFAHVGEEYGFLGGCLLLGLYALLIIWSLHIARHARDRFGVLLAVGIAALFFWHVLINVGMVVGMLPVVGLWLPFVSYGGSSLLTVMVCVGLLMNLSIRRHVFHGL